MPGTIQVDNMTKAERARLVEAISGGNGQQPVAANEEQEGEEGEGHWEEYIPWYVRPMQVGVYIFAYTMLGLGWLVTHIGVGLTWLGHEAKNAVRNID
jgi:hypothetical protein